jgi:hypothetical protein
MPGPPKNVVLTWVCRSGACCRLEACCSSRASSSYRAWRRSLLVLLGPAAARLAVIVIHPRDPRKRQRAMRCQSNLSFTRAVAAGRLRGLLECAKRRRATSVATDSSNHPLISHSDSARVSVFVLAAELAARLLAGPRRPLLR